MLEQTSKVASFPGPAQFSVVRMQRETGNEATSKVGTCIIILVVYCLLESIVGQ